MVREETIQAAIEQKKEVIMSVREVKGRRISVQNIRLAQRCCKMVPKRLVISFKNKWRSAWDFVPMGLSLYNAVTIPLALSFPLSYEFHRFK